MESKEETVNIDEVRQEICNMVNTLQSENLVVYLYSLILNIIE